MTRSKAIGTRDETAVVKWLHAKGFDKARRYAPQGQNDKGDVEVCEGFILEVKHRNPRNSNSSLGQPGEKELLGWLWELDAEMNNYYQETEVPVFGALVVKRKGTTSPGNWWAYVFTRDVVDIHYLARTEVGPMSWLCTTADQMLAVARGCIGARK